MDEPETEPLTKADFPDDARHAGSNPNTPPLEPGLAKNMREMTPEERARFLRWVAAIPYIVDPNYPNVRVAYDRASARSALDGRTGEHRPAMAKADYEIELRQAETLAEYVGSPVTMLPENYAWGEDGKQRKIPDTVADGRTVELKYAPAGNKAQRRFLEGMKQGWDVFLTVPEWVTPKAAREMIHGGIKCLKEKYGPECRLDARVFVNPTNTRMVYELRINTLGVALHWENDAQMASLSAAVNPVVPTNTNNITSNSDFSSKNPTTGVKPEGCQGGSRPADKAMEKLFPKKPKITAGFASTNSIQRGQFSAAARSLVLILLASIVPVALAYEDYDDDDDGLAETDFSFSAVAGSRATQSRAMGVSWELPKTQAAAQPATAAPARRTLPPTDHVPTLAEYSAVSDIPGAVPAANPRHQEATTSAPARRRETASYIDGLRQGRAAQGEIALPPETAAAIQSDSVVWAGEETPGFALNPEDLPLPDLDDGPETQGLFVAATNSGRPTLPPPPERRIGDGERAAQTVTGLPLPVAAQAPRKTDAMERITLPPERPERKAPQVQAPVASAQGPAARGPVARKAPTAAEGAGRSAAQAQRRPQTAPARPAPSPSPSLTKEELAALRPATPTWHIPEKGQRPQTATALQGGRDDYAKQVAADYRLAAAAMPEPPETEEPEGFDEPEENCVYADGMLRFFYSQARPLLRCSARNLTDVELHEDEQIVALRLGDPSRWKTETFYIARTPHLVVRPVSNGYDTSMVVVTNQRTYYFDLTARKGDHYGRVGFLYDDQPVAPTNWHDRATHYAALLPGGAQLSGWVIAGLLAVFGFLSSALRRGAADK